MTNMFVNKYHNVKCEYKGIKFDSKREMRRYQELEILQKEGIIQNLELQKRFEIVPKKGLNNRARYYVADFVYEENGLKVIEDVKSKISQTPVFQLKWALMKTIYTEYDYRIYGNN